jgi:hypothetical protein
VPDFRGARTGEPIEERIGRLEDIESIKQLYHQYATYCDNGYDADGMGSLCTDDAVWESNKFGTYHGREEIKGFIVEAGKMLVFALHYMDNATIDVAPDGQSATGRWILFEPAVMTREGEEGTDSVIITADYLNDFVKVDGEWRIKHVRANFRTIANLQDGWHDERFRGA